VAPGERRPGRAHASGADRAELRDAGIGIAIDDFGTGYSSLRLLSRLPVDTLKIDRTFVQNVTDSSKGLTLVSTIVSLARAFDMHTVAEGVETLEQLRTLQQMACEQAQGFLFARPGPAAEVASVIARLTQPTARTIAEQAASRRH
jgi:diguanylate cyclase